MKMFMPLLSPATGVIHWVLPEGSILSAGDLIARLDLENPAAVTQAMPFEGDFPPMGAPVLESEGVDAWFSDDHGWCAIPLDFTPLSMPH